MWIVDTEEKANWKVFTSYLEQASDLYKANFDKSKN